MSAQFQSSHQTVNTQTYRKFPKNTWRLTRLQQRYVKIRSEEEFEADGGYLSYSESDQELRSHLINNFDFITSALNSTSISNSNLKTCSDTTRPIQLDEQIDTYAKSVSSIPSLTSEDTSSPSLSVHSHYNEEDPHHNHHHHQFVPEHSEK